MSVNVCCFGNLPESLRTNLSAAYETIGFETIEGILVSDPDVLSKQKILATTSHSLVSRELLDCFPNIQLISNLGAGVDSIDVKHASSRNILVSHTPGVLTSCVADLAVGLLIDINRGITRADKFLRNGGWQISPFSLTSRLTGKKIGLVGLGRIGLAIAKRLAGFDVALGYHSRRKLNVPHPYFERLVNLASWSDYLIVCVPGGHDTEKLVSSRIISSLGPKGTLINISRGSVIDQDALIAALKDGSLGGAALDVFENEPDVPQQLIDQDNVVLTPHIASATLETRIDMERLVLENIEAFLRTGKPLYLYT